MTLGKSKVFLILCIAFIVGIFAGSFINYTIIAIAAIVFVICTTVWWHHKAVFILFIAGVCMLLGSLRFIVAYQQNDLKPYYGQNVHVSGVITEEPDERDDKTNLTLGKIEVNGNQLESKLLVITYPYPQYQYGQKLEFEGKISEPKEYPDFSYKNYLSRFGIDGLAYRPQIIVAEGNYGFPPKVFILRLKQSFVDTINQILPEPHNSLLSGLLLGAKHSIPQALKDQFNRTGTSHIVAISGFNITIIIYAVERLLQFFRKRVSFIISILIIVGFVIMTGASASVIRAAIMGGLVLLALNIGRVYTIANSLALTAVIMLLVNPQILVFDIGFQLSFAALLGLVYLIPLLEPYFLWFPKLLRPYLLATLAAEIFTLPILLYNFGELSLVAPIVNVLVLAVVPLTMMFGFISTLCALIAVQLASPVTGLTYLLLTYILKVIEAFAKLPFATITWHIPAWLLLGYYLILFWFVFTRSRKFAKMT